MDFSQLRAMVDNIVRQFDGEALSEIDYFRHNNPSAENVARFIYRKLKKKLPKSVKLRTVRVSEEPGCWASCSR
jgi:6-pyruvoyltetrahydropterin/6-carboxytetrahydropterin synthase